MVSLSSFYLYSFSIAIPQANMSPNYLHANSVCRCGNSVIIQYVCSVTVAIGAVAGLFLGCSILSFVEIIYFFTLRLFWFFYNGRLQ